MRKRRQTGAIWAASGCAGCGAGSLVMKGRGIANTRETTTISGIRKRLQRFSSEHRRSVDTLVCRASQGSAVPDLDGAVGGYQLVLEVPRPEAGTGQVRK